VPKRAAYNGNLKPRRTVGLAIARNSARSFVLAPQGGLSASHNN
jgi:hypothetical protein